MNYRWHMQIDIWPTQLRAAATDMASQVDSLYTDVVTDESAALRIIDGLPTGLLCQQATLSFLTAARGLSSATHEQVHQIAARLTAMADATDECDQAIAGLFTQLGSVRGWDVSSKAGSAEHVVADTDELYELQGWLDRQARAMDTAHGGYDKSVMELHSGWQGLAATAGDRQAQRSSAQLQSAQVFVSDVAEVVQRSAAALEELGDTLSRW